MKNLQKKKLIIYVIAILILAVLCMFSGLLNPIIINSLLKHCNIVTRNQTLVVHYINVGQGDAISINLPDGKVMLIDSGTVGSNGEYVSYIKENVMSSNKDNNIDYLVLSHGDSDHSGGCLRLLDNFNVKTVVLPKYPADNNAYTDFINTAIQKGCNLVNAEDISDIENSKYLIKFYVPDAIEGDNQCSTVVKLEYLNKSFLFTGDTTAEKELQLVEKYGSELDCDVLKVAHHGSKYSSSNEFLQVVTPKVSIISCGYNSYGHPTSEAISNILATGSQLFRTDVNGNIVLIVGKNYNLTALFGNVVFTPLSLNYCYIIFIIQGFLICKIVIVIFKKKDTKNNKLK